MRNQAPGASFGSRIPGYNNCAGIGLRCSTAMPADRSELTDCTGPSIGTFNLAHHLQGNHFAAKIDAVR
jgi:hypothetical protein